MGAVTTDIMGGATGARLSRIAIELNLLFLALFALALSAGTGQPWRGIVAVLDPARPNSLVEGWAVLQLTAAGLLALALGRGLPVALLLPLAVLPLGLAAIEIVGPHRLLAAQLAPPIKAAGGTPGLAKLAAIGMVGLPLAALVVLPLRLPGWRRFGRRFMICLGLLGLAAAALDPGILGIASSPYAVWAARGEEVAELFLSSCLAALIAGAVIERGAMARKPSAEMVLN